MNYEKLANELFFAKEAADYLGISTQRLNQLVHDGKIVPVKKTNSGTIFHIEELRKRKEELNIFSEQMEGGTSGMFLIDNKVKQEALNFATLMNLLNRTESSLEPEFNKFEEKYDVGIPMIEDCMIKNYAVYFGVGEGVLKQAYRTAEKAFSKLRSEDEIVKRGNSDYPPLLLKTEQAPRFLYLRGNKALLFEKRTVALVGSRNASEEAKLNTKRVAISLGKNGITVISGLAKGIDVTAHKAALEYGYNTIAVIGTNLNQYYPAENRKVQEEIEKKGLVVSQFSPATKTERWFFPLRNGVMSGLSLATVIMEAGETSGALKQADFAMKQGRQILIPQKALEIESITWPRKYRDKGAKIVSSPKDILIKLSENEIFNPQINVQTDMNEYLDLNMKPQTQPNRRSELFEMENEHV